MQVENPRKLQRRESSLLEPAAAAAFGETSGSKVAYAAALQRKRGKAGAAACRSSRLMYSAKTAVTAATERAEVGSNSTASGAEGSAVTSCREKTCVTAAAPSVGESNTATSAARPWSDLPEPLILQVLSYGGNELATSELSLLLGL